MKTIRFIRHALFTFCTLALLGILFLSCSAQAVTTVFFNSSQTTNLVASGSTSDTISSAGYLFTYTRDKLFTGGVGLTNPIGRNVRIPWPEGLEAQAVTSGPTLSDAKITIKRQDGQLFAIESFTFKLLANTAGAGASLEIMPLLNGEDGVPNPFMYNATGIAGNSFTCSTPELTGFDAYKITLYVDYALMSLTAVDASLPPPSLEITPLDVVRLQLSWPTNAIGYVIESSTYLPAPIWTPLTNSVTVIGDWFATEVAISDSMRLFRLRKQRRRQQTRLVTVA